VTVFSPLTLSQNWGCSERHVRNLIASGKLRAFRLGDKLLRITAEAAEDFQCRQATDLSDTGTAGTSNIETPTKDDNAAHLARLTAPSLKVVSRHG
jgi:hypothetical protein